MRQKQMRREKQKQDIHDFEEEARRLIVQQKYEVTSKIAFS